MKTEIEWIPIEYDEGGQIISKMPENNQEVLVSFKTTVGIDTFFNDDGYYFDNYYFDDIKAWAYLPKPYKEEK